MQRRLGPENRTLATHACDACRLRKVKCRSESCYPCERCVRLALSCTFNLPSRTRGPKKRPRGTQSQTSVTLSHGGEVSASGAEDESGEMGGPSTDCSPTGTTCRITAVAGSNTSPFGDDASPTVFPTDILCSRELVQQMLEDYLRDIYPLIPVVHRPTFRQDVAASREAHDSDFLGLIFSICAVVVGTMPSKFQQYQSSTTPLPSETRADFVSRTQTLQLDMRPWNYFDQISFQKWATSYLMFIALSQTGQANRARMVEVECLQLARLLGLHRISEYEGLNYIEVQLRKKGFWLMFYNYVHSQVQYVRKEKLTFLDSVMLLTIDLEELLPLDIDDEGISQDHIQSRSPGSSQPCLTTGFIIHSHVFRAAIQARHPDKGCHCAHLRGREAELKHIQQRLRELKYMLHTIPPQLRQRASHFAQLSTDNFSDTAEAVTSQFGAMRANIHGTHLWLQALLLDQIDALCQGLATPPEFLGPLSSQAIRWSERENICSQLLHLLHSMPPQYFEPNGLHFVHKVRDVAVGLLACPFEPRNEEFVEATEHIWEFTEVLSWLDSSETVSTSNLQTWVDTDRERRHAEAQEGAALDRSPLVQNQ